MENIRKENTKNAQPNQVSEIKYEIVGRTGGVDESKSLWILKETNTKA